MEIFVATLLLGMELREIEFWKMRHLHRPILLPVFQRGYATSEPSGVQVATE